jgi:uncharacterized damage-inducible protein DinB
MKSPVQRAVKRSINNAPKGPMTRISELGRTPMQSLTKTEEHAVSRAFVASSSEFLVRDFLPKIERCLETLTDEQIWWRANEQSNSIGNLILHLCGNARQWIISGVGSQPDARVRDAEFEQRDPIPRNQLLTLLRSTLSEIETVLQSLDPAIVLERRKIQGQDVEILHAIFHVTEHFSMHTGQIIMLTKMMTSSDLRFYDFPDGLPIETWHSAKQD